MIWGYPYFRKHPYWSQCPKMYGWILDDFDPFWMKKAVPLNSCDVFFHPLVLVFSSCLGTNMSTFATLKDQGTRRQLNSKTRRYVWYQMILNNLVQFKFKVKGSLPLPPAIRKTMCNDATRVLLFHKHWWLHCSWWLWLPNVAFFRPRIQWS